MRVPAQASDGGVVESGGAGTILFGGSGFLGPYILRNYPNMISVGRTPAQTPNRHVSISGLSDLSPLKDVEFDKVIYIIGNTDHHSLEKATISRNEPTAFDYHLLPLIQTLEQLKERPISRFLHFSTVLIYDEKRITLPVSENAPIDPYKNRYVCSKYLAEEACRFYQQWIPITNIRLSNIYGPTPLQRFDLIHVLIHQLLSEGRGEVWSTRPGRDFIYIEDAAHAIARLLDAGYNGTLNLGTGTTTSVSHVVDLLRQISGCPITDLDVPVKGPAEFQCDMSTLNQLIDWKPLYSIDEGVRTTWETMRAWKKD
ncbi:MAG: NAD(P)-dependent oxidoreductase [Acidobacteriota bacterium]